MRFDLNSNQALPEFRKENQFKRPLVRACLAELVVVQAVIRARIISAMNGYLFSVIDTTTTAAPVFG